MNKLDFYATKNIAGVSYDIYGRQGGAIMLPVVFEMDTKVDNNTYHDPSMRFSFDDAQSLFQSLWDAGLRPNNGESSMAHVEAMRYHLEDMRKLVKGLT
jgi:hypothetical protein